MQGAGYLVPNNQEEHLSGNRQVSSPLIMYKQPSSNEQTKNTYTGQAKKTQSTLILHDPNYTASTVTIMSSEFGRTLFLHHRNQQNTS